MVSIGGGKSKSKSSTTQLSAEQRRAVYEGGLQDIGKSLGTWNPGTGTTAMPTYVAPSYTNISRDTSPSYVAPSYTEAGSPRQLADGDYSRLEENIREQTLAPLRAYETKQREMTNQDAADRGIWSSGLAMQAQNDVTEAIAPQIASASAGAVAARYGLESQDNANVNAFNLASTGDKNQFALTDSAQANQFALTDAAQKDAFNLTSVGDKNNFALAEAAAQNKANWTPYEYMLELYKQTGGANSSGSSSAWNANASVLGG